MFSQDQINFIKEKAPMLPEPERRAICAICWEGLSEWDLGKEFGISPYEVFDIKKRGLESLEKMYKDEFKGTEPLHWWKVRWGGK